MTINEIIKAVPYEQMIDFKIINIEFPVHDIKPPYRAWHVPNTKNPNII